jgi:hypothetical protein
MGMWKHQIPSTNNQIMTNHQIPITKISSYWVIGYWSLFGAWDLGIGIAGIGTRRFV